MLLASYLMWSAALDSSNLLLPYSITSLALHISVILITTHFATPTCHYRSLFFLEHEVSPSLGLFPDHGSLLDHCEPVAYPVSVGVVDTMVVSLSLNGYISIPLVSYSIQSGVLDSSTLHLSYPITIPVSYITIILIFPS